MNDDTINLLQKCNSGTQMAVYSIDEVLDQTTSSELKQILSNSKAKHEALGNETHSLLAKYEESIKNPNPIAKGMSWMKTNTKLSFNGSDQAIADLITDGCNMGIKSLYRYQNEYGAADDNAKKSATELIRLEETLRHDIVSYL